MADESGSSYALLWHALILYLILRAQRTDVPPGAAPQPGRVLARLAPRTRALVTCAWAVGVVALLVAGARVAVEGLWWYAVPFLGVVLAWADALVQNVRRRHDPVDGQREWSTWSRWISTVGVWSWIALLTLWVVADLSDGSWADALPGVAGWCAFMAILTTELRSRRRALEALAERPPLRRDPGSGVLLLRRPANRWAVGVRLAVHIDRRLVAELKAGEQAAVTVDAGEHDVYFFADDVGIAAEVWDVPDGAREEVELLLDENAASGLRYSEGALTVYWLDRDRR